MPETTPEKLICRQCGTCCRKGGPALHHEDLKLLRSGFIKYEHLTTIRKGEPAFSPLTGRVEPAAVELIKISGRQGQWTCCFFDEAASQCRIYQHRPLECRLLQCRDTTKLLAVVNKDTLSRRDILASDDPLLALIALHEQECPAARLQELFAELSSNSNNPDTVTALNDLVRKDLEFRNRAVSLYRLSAAVEFFILGRPLFKILSSFGLTAREQNGNLHLQWHK